MGCGKVPLPGAAQCFDCQEGGRARARKRAGYLPPRLYRDPSDGELVQVLRLPRSRQAMHRVRILEPGRGSVLQRGEKVYRHLDGWKRVEPQAEKGARGDERHGEAAEVSAVSEATAAAAGAARGGEEG